MAQMVNGLYDGSRFEDVCGTSKSPAISAASHRRSRSQLLAATVVLSRLGRACAGNTIITLLEKWKCWMPD